MSTQPKTTETIISRVAMAAGLVLIGFTCGVLATRAPEVDPPPTRAVLECPPAPDLKAEIAEQRAEIRFVADRALSVSGRLDTLERACISAREDGR